MDAQDSTVGAYLKGAPGESIMAIPNPARTAGLLAAAIVAASAWFLTAGCGGSRPPGLTGEIRADGSSTVFLLTTAVAEQFKSLNPGVQVAVAASGTGAGFETFCKGGTDVQNASRPISGSEQELCQANNVTYVEVPVAHDAVTIIVNSGNTWASNVTVAELRKLWSPAAEKKVTRWSQIRAGWPDEGVHLYGPGTKSGSFDFFTQMIVGSTGASRSDYTASEDDTVIVKGVTSDRLAMGYIGYGYFDRNRSTLRAVAIDDGDESIGRGAIAPSPENVRRGVYRPLSRTLFIYVNTKSLEKPAVAAFVDFYLKKDEELVHNVGGIPMSTHSYELVRKRVASRTVGTLFTAAAANISDLELLLAGAR